MTFDVSIALCTYKRPLLLKQCLDHLLRQRTSERFEIVIVDNDAEGSAETIVSTFRDTAEKLGIELRYFIEPVQNISLARNKAVSECKGRYIAFIDDDEYPVSEWLERLCETLNVYQVDGVFGPVIPFFPMTFPEWLSNSKLFDRPRLKTGTFLNGNECRTGNGLIVGDVLRMRAGQFDPSFGRTGGEDSFYFARLQNQGCSFCWCDDAVVYEAQEEQRMFLPWHIIRGYRGGWAYARTLMTTRGICYGTALLIGSVFSGSIKLFIRSLSSLHNPKAALWFFLQGLASQIGKIGYFLNIKIDEYGGR